MSLVIAGERSGVGKTTVTLALLSYLCQRGLRVQSFKVGPDYIDPMFHRHVTGRPCRTLDPVLTSERYVQQCFAQQTQAAEYALVEGVMGLFDGAGPEIQAAKLAWQMAGFGEAAIAPSLAKGVAYGSTAHVAALLNVPVVLVVDCSRMAHSIAALVQGYRSYDPGLQMAGVVLNRVGSDRHLAMLKAALEPLGVPILGVLQRHAEITIPDRHLGLVPTAELPQLKALTEKLAHLATGWFDWAALLPLLQVTPPSAASEVTGDAIALSATSASQPLSLPVAAQPEPRLRLAIAYDAAFSFYYADNLDLLAALGAELVYWSPLADAALPPAIHGLYLGGGFPEMFAAQLAENRAARAAVRAAILAGLPTYAECGGLMYLGQTITDFQNHAWEMVGVLPTATVMGKWLKLGYRQVTALADGVLCGQGAIAWGHEFHRSHLTVLPQAPLFAVEVPAAQPSLLTEGFHQPNLHASYVHLHWGNTPQLPQRFLAHCQAFASAGDRNVARPDEANR